MTIFGINFGPIFQRNFDDKAHPHGTSHMKGRVIVTRCRVHWFIDITATRETYELFKPFTRPSARVLGTIVQETESPQEHLLEKRPLAVVIINVCAMRHENTCSFEVTVP